VDELLLREGLAEPVREEGELAVRQPVDEAMGKATLKYKLLVPNRVNRTVSAETAAHATTSMTSNYTTCFLISLRGRKRELGVRLGTATK